MLAWLFVERAQEESRAPLQSRIPVVRVTRPSVRDLPIRLSYPAELQAIQAYDIRPVEAKGTIRRLTVDKGDRIRKGQLLVEVDCPEYHARRQQAEEGVKAAQAIYANARITLSRIEPMRAKNFISQLELDNARAAYDSAEARLKNEGARLAEAKQLLGYCEIRAPFHGEVVMRWMDPGDLVRPGGRPILAIAAREVMRIQLSVVERDDAAIQEGLPAEMTVSGLPGRTFRGTVTRVVRRLDPRTRTFLAEIEIPNTTGILKPGMFGRVTLVVDRRARAVFVPAASLLATDKGSWVFVVEDGRVRQAPVQVGHDTGDEIEIVRGLRGEETIVMIGRDLVSEGAFVQVVR